MIDQTIKDLEFRIQNAPTLTSTQRRDLQTLVETLRQEVVELAKTHPVEANNITLASLRASVKRFEKTHPVLTQTVNNLATYFSNLGI